MIIRLVGAAEVIRSTWSAVTTVAQDLAPATTATTPAPLLPDPARSWLAALRLLSGVPFQHLVPDTRLLPMESARFFFVDRGWTDALLQGALSVGAVTDADRAVLQEVYPAVRDDLDQAERSVRVPGGEQAEVGSADVLTGMLIRSQAVSGWPGIHIRAYRDPNTPDTAQDDPSRLHIMRLELLAASVLLVIFDGTPAIVHIDEPRHGIQFGVDENTGSSPGNWSYQLTVRPNASSGDLTEGNAPPISVPFRANAPGVIDMAALQAAITGAGQAESSTMFALQMIRLPYRQVLGPPEQGPRHFPPSSRPTSASRRCGPGRATRSNRRPPAARRDKRPDERSGALAQHRLRFVRRLLSRGQDRYRPGQPDDLGPDASSPHASARTCRCPGPRGRSPRRNNTRDRPAPASQPAVRGRGRHTASDAAGAPVQPGRRPSGRCLPALGRPGRLDADRQPADAHCTSAWQPRRYAAPATGRPLARSAGGRGCAPPHPGLDDRVRTLPEGRPCHLGADQHSARRQPRQHPGLRVGPVDDGGRRGPGLGGRVRRRREPLRHVRRPERPRPPR